MDETITLQVQVPEGMWPGQQMLIQAPDGRNLSVQLPAHAAPGVSLAISVPALSSGPPAANVISWTKKATSLQSELEQLTIKDLRLRAKAEGVDNDAVEDARDGDTPKESLIELILANTTPAADDVADARP